MKLESGHTYRITTDFSMLKQYISIGLSKGTSIEAVRETPMHDFWVFECHCKLFAVPNKVIERMEFER